MDLDSSLGYFGIFALLLSGSAFFSGTETALFSLSKFQLHKMDKAHGDKIKIINTLLSDQKGLLTAILLGNEFVNILASVLASTLIGDLVRSGWASQRIAALGIGISPETLGVAVSIFLMTFALLIFGEVTPKAVAMANPTGFALFVTRPIHFFFTASKYVVRVVLWINNLLIRLFGIRLDSEAPFITPEELDALVSFSQREGIIGEKEKEMIDGIVSIGETTAVEVMTPRMDVIGLDLDSPPENLFEFIREIDKSRLPVFEGHLDRIVGLLYVKDLLPFIKKSRKTSDVDVRAIMRSPYFVPENKKVDDLLQEMQRKKLPFAVVVDEYGGTEGIVTLEDILEEIFGEIIDESDDESPELVDVGRGTYLLDAKVSSEDVEELTGISIEGDGYDTVGGFVFNILDRIPYEGDRVIKGGYEFKVVKMAGNRIIKVQIKMLPPEARPDSEAPLGSLGSEGAVVPRENDDRNRGESAGFGEDTGWSSDRRVIDRRIADGQAYDGQAYDGQAYDEQVAAAMAAEKSAAEARNAEARIADARTADARTADARTQSGSNGKEDGGAAG